MKICIKCKIPKELKEFNKNKRKKDGLEVYCKECVREKSKQYYLENKIIHNKRTSQYIQNNKEKHKNLMDNWYENNKEKLKPIYKQYYLDNKDTIIEKSKIWQSNNKEQYQEYQKEWRLNNKEKLKFQINKWIKNERINNPLFKLKHSLRSRISDIIKNDRSKSKLIIELLGCSLKDYKQYIEQQFKTEMNWNNHGDVWEIDHKKSISFFDLNDPKQLNECFHYTNTQPLFKTTKIAESFGYSEIGNRNKLKYV